MCLGPRGAVGILDLSRFDAAPLIAVTATRETNYGIEPGGENSTGCSVYSACLHAREGWLYLAVIMVCIHGISSGGPLLSYAFWWLLRQKVQSQDGRTCAQPDDRALPPKLQTHRLKFVSGRA